MKIISLMRVVDSKITYNNIVCCHILLYNLEKQLMIVCWTIAK